MMGVGQEGMMGGTGCSASSNSPAHPAHIGLKQQVSFFPGRRNENGHLTREHLGAVQTT